MGITQNVFILLDERLFKKLANLFIFIVFFSVSILY